MSVTKVTHPTSLTPSQRHLPSRCPEPWQKKLLPPPATHLAQPLLSVAATLRGSQAASNPQRRRLYLCTSLAPSPRDPGHCRPPWKRTEQCSLPTLGFFPWDFFITELQNVSMWKLKMPLRHLKTSIGLGLP